MHGDSYICFTFSLPCITTQLLQFEPMNALSFIKIIIILQHSGFYMFQASLAHHQGAQLDKTVA